MRSPLGEGAAAVIFDPTGLVLLVKENTIGGVEASRVG